MGRSVTGNTSNVTVAGTVTTLTAQAGRQPGTPSITSPTSNELLSSFTPTMTTGSFFNYGSDTHTGTNWQISSDPQFSETSIVYELASNSALTSLTLGSSDLPRDAGTYYVRARHVSSGYEASNFSVAQPFRIDATIGASVAANGASTFLMTASYTGTGSFSSLTYSLSASSDMSNPVSTGTFSSTTKSLNYTVAPGLFTGTDYYLQLTSVGANAVPKTEVITLTGDITSGVSGSSSATYDGTNVVVASTLSVTGSPTIVHQFSTTSTFDTVYYSTSSTQFSATNLPGISDRSQSYYYRPVAQLGNDNVPLQAAASVGAAFLYTSSTSFNSVSGYTGSILVEAIGGGGSGAGAYSSGSGGSSGNFESATVSITQQESISITIGQGGPGSGWSDPSNTYAGTTSVSIGSVLSLSAAGGTNAPMNNQSKVYGQDTNKSAFGGRPGNAIGGSVAGEDGQDHPITGLSGGGGGGHDSGGGAGGYGYGAGGGGQTRQVAYGGNGGGGGGGGGAFSTSVAAGSGSFDNVGSGGSGLSGAVRLTYQNW